ADGGRAVVFTLPALSDLRQGPFQGKGLVVNGRPGVVVSAFDSFLSGELGRDRALQIRVVPNARAAITSFDLGPAPPDAGGLLDAWTKVDLDAVVAGAAADPGWEGGSLHAVEEPSERALYVITAHGNVVRIYFDPATCP